MKRKIKVLYAVLLLVSMMYCLYLVLELDWSLLDVKMLSVIAVTLSVLTTILYGFLFIKLHSKKSIYISCGVEDKEQLDYITKLIPKSVKIEDTLNLDCGGHLSSCLTEKIGKSAMCFMIISQKMTKFQRVERGTMKNLGKECVPIIVGDEYEVKNFKNIVPVFLKDKNLKEKLLGILMKNSIFI